MTNSGSTLDYRKLMCEALVRIEGLQATIRRLRSQLDNGSWDTVDHPLLDRRMACPWPVFSGSLSLARTPCFTVPFAGETHVPSSVWLEMALSAHVVAHGDIGAEARANRAVTLSDVWFDQPLALTDDEPRTVQCLLSGDGDKQFEIHSSQTARGSQIWLRHAAGEIHLGQPGATSGAPLSEARFRLREVVSAEAFCDELSGRGLQLGPAIGRIVELRRRDGEALVRVQLSPTPKEQANYCVHPAMLDSAIQVLAVALPKGEIGSDCVLMPAGMRALRWCGRFDTACFSHVVVRSYDESKVEADVRLRSESGELLVAISSFTCEVIPVTELTAATEAIGGGAVHVDPEKLRRLLKHAGPVERAELVQPYLGSIAAAALGLPTWKLDPHQSLYRSGLDSLMLVRLREQIERDLGIVLDSAELTDESLSPATLTSYLLKRLEAGD